MTKEFKEQVLEWIQNNGYPLEMLVAQKFRASDAFYVDQSRHYIDSATQKLREADVVATWAGVGRGGVPVSVRVVVECKALDKSKGNRKAWILFTDNDVDDDLGTDFSLALIPKRKVETEGVQRIVESLVNETAPKMFEEVGRSCYAITQMRSSQNDKDWSHDATRQALSAAIGINNMEKTAREDDRDSYLCSIPAIVTDNPMFVCWLDENGEIMLEETNREILLAPTDDGSGYVLIHIVNVSELDTFINDCSTAAKSFFVSSHTSGPVAQSKKE